MGLPVDLKIAMMVLTYDDQTETYNPVHVSNLLK